MQEVTIHKKIDISDEFPHLKYERVYDIVFNTRLGKIGNRMRISNELLNDEDINIDEFIISVSRKNIELMIEEK